MKLKKVTIHKYKCIENSQEFEVENDITILVGMNESGKTAILEAIAKANYFQEDATFKFNLTRDYPRKEKKQVDKSGEDPIAVTCDYGIDDELKAKIENDIGKNLITSNSFSISTKYSNNRTWNGLRVDLSKFVSHQTKKLGVSGKTLDDKLSQIKTSDEFHNVLNEYKDEKNIEAFRELEKYFVNEWGWDNPIEEYVARQYLEPNLPKFLYYDEYYSLPSRISIEKMQEGDIEDEEMKTAKALFELADINIDELINAEDFEDFISELEATEAAITDILFKYWKTNRNLNIEFKIDKVEKTVAPNNRQIVEHILDIRVKNQRARVSLPLRNRSKGFNWFFSFLVWFKKIQEDNTSSYILLLDEPGLNLHASAQKDLLEFIEDLTKNYQIIYTTHSPFMIPSEKLHRIRTILETENGSKISDSLQEKDPNTLFPLQAALGYDIAQNLFISKKNLLVEGVSDLIFLQILSSILECKNRDSLRAAITIVPVGALDKVSTFISLLRGSELETVCLLDSFIDSKGKQKVDDLVKQKIIKARHIRFYHEFIEGMNKADLEDLFEKNEYLILFNQAFSEYEDIKIDDLNPDINNIIIQINQHLGIDRFNHYRPANELSKLPNKENFLSAATLGRFESMFREINKLFK